MMAKRKIDKLMANQRSGRKAFLVVGLIVGLLAAGAALAWRGAGKGPANKPSEQSGAVAAQSLTPGSPAKEYVYAGSRLIATEEPSSGGAAPPAPTGLTATPGNAQVSLTWNSVAGASTYTVKRSTTSGGGYAVIATGLTSPSYTNTTGLINGTTYYFVVSAVNSFGEGPNSNEAAATPNATPSPPPAPTGLTATAGNAQVALSWNAAAGASSYTVKRATVSGGPYANLASGLTQTAYTDTNVVNGTTYYYVVSASNVAGEGPNSAQASATPNAGQSPPAAPTNLTATAGNAQVGLAWTAAAGATSYNVKRSTTSGGPYTTVATGLTATGYSDGSLINGTTYYYVVSASNAGGESANSNQASATPSGGGSGVPNAPTNLRVSGFNSLAVGLNWDHDGQNLTGFVLERKAGAGSFTPLTTLAATARGYKDSAVTHGTTYQYRIKATNGSLTSGYSNIVTVTP
jgi:fibronectin type 3 domain-containing protein